MNGNILKLQIRRESQFIETVNSAKSLQIRDGGDVIDFEDKSEELRKLSIELNSVLHVFKDSFLNSLEGDYSMRVDDIHDCLQAKLKEAS
jgi:hypothetical protein